MKEREKEVALLAGGPFPLSERVLDVEAMGE